MKYLEYEYNEDTKVSTCTIGTKWGTFTATARLSDEDVDVESPYTGVRFAEHKCRTKIANAKRKAMYQRFVGMEDLMSIICDNIDDETYFRIQRQLNKAWNDYITAKEEYKSLANSYKDYVTETLDEHRKLNKRWEEMKKRNAE